MHYPSHYATLCRVKPLFVTLFCKEGKREYFVSINSTNRLPHQHSKWQIYYILPLLFDLAKMAESQCDFVHNSHIACGKSIQYDNDCSIIPLFLCEKNTACHLQRINCFTKQNVPECILILYRSGLFDSSSSTLNIKICQKYRDAFGIYCKRTSAKSRFTEHPTASRSRQGCIYTEL